LGLEGRPSSETIETDKKIKVLAGVPENFEEPWLPRKVLLDSNRSPVAICIPTVPRDLVEHGISIASRTWDTASVDLYAESREPTTSKLPAPKPDTPLSYSIVRIAVGGGSFTRRIEKREQMVVTQVLDVAMRI
jgi:hypothetical protein